MTHARSQFTAFLLTSLLSLGAAKAQQTTEAQQTSAVSAEAPSEPRGFELAGLGGLAWIGFGIPAGDAAGPSYGVYEPVIAIGAHAELSYAFVYLGGSFQFVRFTDKEPTMQSVMNESGNEFVAEGTSSMELYDVELGLAHGFPLGGSFRIRPALGFGISTDGEVTKNIASCVDCAAYPVLDAYRGGKFLRGQVGVYHHGDKLSLGLNVSLQQFLTEVPEPALNRVLLFGLSLGGGGGL